MSDQVTHRVEQHRFVLGQGEELSELVYRRNGKRLVLLHTGVPEVLRHQGRAGLLAAAAVKLAADEKLIVVPVCPYARAWLTEHPEEAASVEVDWSVNA